MNCYGRIILTGVTALCCVGCGDSTTSQPAAVPAEPTSPVASAPAAPPPPTAPNITGAIQTVTEESAQNGSQSGSPATDPEPDMEREKADVGAGRRGRDYGGGIISEPVRSYFRIRQRAVFQIQLPQAERMYKAENDGIGPTSHEAYMRDIIEANGISLPELPEGETYFYDADQGELMVQRPKN